MSLFPPSHKSFLLHDISEVEIKQPGTLQCDFQDIKVEIESMTNTEH